MTFSEAPDLLCPHSQRGCFSPGIFGLTPGEKGSGFLEEAQLHPSYDSKLINMFQTFH